MTHPPESMAAKAARERLEHTRRELLRHMSQDRAAPGEGANSPYPHPTSDQPDMKGPDAPFRQAPPEDGLASLWHTLQHTASAWWHSHPARLALEVAEPLFDKYARAHPTKVLTIAAATGAALVLAKPWRLMSVTGLLVTAAKSTQVSALVAALFRPQASGPQGRSRAHAMAAANAASRTPPQSYRANGAVQTHEPTHELAQADAQPAQGHALPRKPLH